jgi:DHA1 family multidrug resistance protein-like MFS transporter
VLARIKETPILRGLPREVGVISAIAFCVALGFGIVAPAIPIYAKTFGVSAFLAGAVISVFALMRFISAPVVGALIDRAGERRLLTSGLLIVAVSSVMAGLAGNYVQLLTLRGIGGIGSSMFTVSAMALMLKVVSAQQRGRAAGAFQAGFLLGGVAGPAVGGLVLAWSVRAPFFVYAAALLLAAVVAWRNLPKEPPGQPIPTVRAPDTSTEQSEVIPSTAPGQNSTTPGSNEPGGIPADDTEHSHTLRQALRSRAYWAALTANLTTGFVTYGLRTSLVPLFVIEGLRSGPSLAGVGFLAAAATQAALLLPAGRLADDRGRKPALIIGASLTILGMLGLVFAGSSWAFIAAMALSGLAAAFMGSAPAAVAGDIAGRAGKGMVIAVFQMTADLGAIIGPLLAGLLADTLGFGPAFAVGAVVAAIALGSAAAMRETLHKTPQ